MRMKYSTPEMEIIIFKYEDVLTASGDWVDDDSNPGYEPDGEGW